MNTKTITRTAILLALTILFQTLGRFIPLGQASQFIVGPLVNACLLVAAAYVGLGGGAVVAVLSPFGAILTGAIIPLPLAPIIAIGNFILVLLFVLFKKKQILGIASGAVLKFLFLWGSVSLFVNLMNVPAKKAALLVTMFSWPQLITAVIGGVIAFIVIKALDKALKEN
jgi:hypothetical protein